MVNFMVNFNGITSKVPFHEFFEFTVEEISQVFEYMGLMSTKETCHVEPMEKYIFLHGDEQEVYKKEERNFIESIGDIYIVKIPSLFMYITKLLFGSSFVYLE